MVDKVKYATATIEQDAHCNCCGWPVIFICCNGPMAVSSPYKENDWWMYCSNKLCVNHEGEAKFQDPLDWVTYRKSDGPV